MDVLDDHPVLRFFLGGLVLSVAVFLAGVLVWQLAQDLALWVFGREVKANIVDTWVEQLGDQTEGELEFQYFLQYRFEAGNGQTITNTTTVSANEWSASDGAGAQVEVVYFPPYPAHSRLSDARYVPLLACLYVPVILIAAALLAAGWQLFRPAIQGGVGAAEKGTEEA